MTSATQDQKRQRAAAFPDDSPLARTVTPASGPLAVEWESTFDRLCYMVAAPDLATKNPRRYQKLIGELTSTTGCTEEEVLAHGNKVRAVLFFAQDNLSRTGELKQLVGRQRYAYRLPRVNPVF